MNNQVYRLFVDMDGTLARFHDRILDAEGAVQIEKMYKPGYFRDLEPFENVVEGVRAFMEHYPQVEVYVLSAVASGDHDIVNQKDSWLDKYLPEIDYEHRIFSDAAVDKASYIMGALQIQIGPTDWLLDDYNTNLFEWRDAGGSALKCVNNINNKGLGLYGGDKGEIWSGPAVDYRRSAEEISRTIGTRLVEKIIPASLLPGVEGIVNNANVAFDSQEIEQNSIDSNRDTR